VIDCLFVFFLIVLFSHQIDVPVGTQFLADALIGTSLIEGEAAGVDPNLDPELAEAIRQSLEEHQQRQQQQQQQQQIKESSKESKEDKKGLYFLKLILRNVFVNVSIMCISYVSY
jgi:hypothetical protein